MTAEYEQKAYVKVPTRLAVCVRDLRLKNRYKKPVKKTLLVKSTRSYEYDGDVKEKTRESNLSGENGDVSNGEKIS